MKTLYPINFDFSTKNLNFQQIARTFWKELGIRFTAVKVIYNAETGSKESITQYRTGILEHDIKGKDLKPMQMSAIQYERLLAKDSYWLKYDQFAWTLADDSKICVIDLDFETDEEYQNFRKENPGLDNLLDQAGYVEKTLKGGGYHFFLPKDLFNGLEKNLSIKGFEVFVQCHLIYGAFTLPNYRALTPNVSEVPEIFDLNSILNLLYKKTIRHDCLDLPDTNLYINNLMQYINKWNTYNNNNIYNNKDNNSKKPINRGLEPIKDKNSLKLSDFEGSVLQLNERQIQNFRPLAPLLQAITQYAADFHVNPNIKALKIDLNSTNLLVQAGIISKPLEQANKGNYELSYIKDLIRIQAKTHGGRFNYLKSMVGIVATNESVSLSLAKDFILFLAETLDFENEVNFTHLKFLDSLAEQGSFTFNPEWQKTNSFDISNLSELELILETDTYNTEIFEYQNPSFRWIPAKVLGQSDNFILINAAKTKELGYLVYTPGNKTSTLDICKKKYGGKKVSIEDCLLLETSFRPDSNSLIFKDLDPNNLADAKVNTFKPSSFIKKLKKSSIESNDSYDKQIEEFERLCPALSDLIDNVTGCTENDKIRKLWLLNHFHHILLERPAGKEEVVVFHGDKGGEGKTTLVEFFTSLVNAEARKVKDMQGRDTFILDSIADYVSSSDIKELSGNFTAPFIRNKIFTIVNEGDFKNEEQKNSLVERCKFIASAGKKLITAKFEHGEIAETYTNVIICTNYQELVFHNRDKNQLDRRAMEFFANPVQMEKLPYFKKAVEQGVVSQKNLRDLLYLELDNLITWFNSRLIDYDLAASRPMSERVSSEQVAKQDGVHRLIEMIENREAKNDILDLAEDADLLSNSSKSGIFDKTEVIKENRQRLSLLIDNIYHSMDLDKGVLIKTGQLKEVFGFKLRTRIKDVWIRSFGARYYDCAWSREYKRRLNYVIKLKGFETPPSNGASQDSD